MAYIRPAGVRRLNPNLLVLLAQSIDLALPPEDIAPLTSALSDQFASAASLDRLNLSEVHPALDFDPSWSVADDTQWEEDLE